MGSGDDWVLKKEVQATANTLKVGVGSGILLSLVSLLKVLIVEGGEFAEYAERKLDKPYPEYFWHFVFGENVLPVVVHGTGGGSQNHNDFQVLNDAWLL